MIADLAKRIASYVHGTVQRHREGGFVVTTAEGVAHHIALVSIGRGLRRIAMNVFDRPGGGRMLEISCHMREVRHFALWLADVVRGCERPPPLWMEINHPGYMWTERAWRAHEKTRRSERPRRAIPKSTPTRIQRHDRRTPK